MQIKTLIVALFAGIAMAMPTDPPKNGGGGGSTPPTTPPTTPPGGGSGDYDACEGNGLLYSSAQCCATDVLGVADLDCAVRKFLSFFSRLCYLLTSFVAVPRLTLVDKLASPVSSHLGQRLHRHLRRAGPTCSLLCAPSREYYSNDYYPRRYLSCATPADCYSISFLHRPAKLSFARPQSEPKLAAHLRQDIIPLLDSSPRDVNVFLPTQLKGSFVGWRFLS